MVGVRVIFTELLDLCNQYSACNHSKERWKLVISDALEVAIGSRIEGH